MRRTGNGQSQLRAASDNAISADPSVVVDLEGLVFIAATSLRVISETAASMSAAGSSTLLTARLGTRLLDVVGLSDVASLEMRGSTTRG